MVRLPQRNSILPLQYGHPNALGEPDKTLGYVMYNKIVTRKLICLQVVNTVFLMTHHNKKITNASYEVQENFFLVAILDGTVAENE